MSFGEQLRGLLKQKGMTQEGLAKAIGRKKLIVGRWIRNESEPSSASLKQMSEFFKMDMLALVDGGKSKKFEKGAKAYKAHATLNGLLQLIWGMKEGAADPLTKEILKEPEEKLRQLMVDRFEK